MQNRDNGNITKNNISFKKMQADNNDVDQTLIPEVANLPKHPTLCPHSFTLSVCKVCIILSGIG